MEIVFIGITAYKNLDPPIWGLDISSLRRNPFSTGEYSSILFCPRSAPDYVVPALETTTNFDSRSVNSKYGSGPFRGFSVTFGSK
jgi:hypothetical protein